MKNYFKKFGIMFVMLLAVIGVVVIQNGIVANAAVVGQPLKTVESGWTRYENDDSSIKYIGSNWSSLMSDSRYTGNKITYIPVGADALSYKVSFKFYGSKFRLIQDKYIDYSTNMTITIDGIEYTPYSLNTTTYSTQILTFEINNLNMTQHIVEIKSTNYRWALDAIDTDGKLLPYDESISLDKPSMDLSKGDSQQLTATTTPAGVGVTWKSSDENIAKYDSTTGKVIAGSVAGTCTITATINDGSNITATCTVTVTDGGVIVDPPVDGDGKLFIELVDGNIKNYDVSSDEINKFINWYNNRDNDDSQTPYFKFTSKDGYKDYVVHDKIDWFEVR